MGQTDALETSNYNALGIQSLFRVISQQAEDGWLPDAVVRFGIRRLLKSRLQDINRQCQPTTTAFLRAISAQPIAVEQDKANEQHYELPPEFFNRVLGERLKYSCCYWTEDTQTLSQAEEQALRLSCENAGLRDGMQVLELGCGWGSMSLWMAEHYPKSSITAISNSHSQRLFIQGRAQELGLGNLNVVTADVNDFTPEKRFDRVVSIEMFEHMRNHRRLMDRIADWLEPQGELFVHIFCHRKTPYLFRSDGEHNWMGRYFFSGGMMPSSDLLEQAGTSFNLSGKWQWDGLHYAKTCATWLKNHDQQRQSLMPLFEETYWLRQARRWYNRWRMFFMACEELFAYNKGQEWFVSHYRFAR